jgi:hypothetical protein
MSSGQENGVTYAILSPEDEGDPDVYVAFGYEIEADGERSFYALPADISLRLTQAYELDSICELYNNRWAVA